MMTMNEALQIHDGLIEQAGQILALAPIAVLASVALYMAASIIPRG
jgi:hypothetical protein